MSWITSMPWAFKRSQVLPNTKKRRPPGILGRFQQRTASIDFAVFESRRRMAQSARAITGVPDVANASTYPRGRPSRGHIPLGGFVCRKALNMKVADVFDSTLWADL